MPKGRISPRFTDCRACHAPMIATHSQGRFCSAPCKLVGERLSWRLYGMRNRERRRIADRLRYDRDPQAVADRVQAYRETPKGRAVRLKAAEPSILKMRARAAVAYALRIGTLTRGPCVCGNPRSQAHHDNYDKPLQVRWMCTRCHGLEHRKPRTLPKENT